MFGSAATSPWYAQNCVPKPGVECPVGVATTICTLAELSVPKWLAAFSASCWICASLGLAGIGVGSEKVPPNVMFEPAPPYWFTVVSHELPATEDRNCVM